MNITITRESVGPADDLFAPYKKILRNKMQMERNDGLGLSFLRIQR